MFRYLGPPPRFLRAGIAATTMPGCLCPPPCCSPVGIAAPTMPGYFCRPPSADRPLRRDGRRRGIFARPRPEGQGPDANRGKPADRDDRTPQSSKSFVRPLLVCTDQARVARHTAANEAVTLRSTRSVAKRCSRRRWTEWIIGSRRILALNAEGLAFTFARPPSHYRDMRPASPDLVGPGLQAISRSGGPRRHSVPLGD